MPYSPSSAAWSGVNKVTKKAAKVAQETLGWITPVGKPMKAVKAGKAVSKAIKVAKKTKPLTTPKSHVKVVAGKSVSKAVSKPKPSAGLENRGARPTKQERINRARDLQWDKAEKNYDAGNEMRYTGLRSSNKGLIAAQGAKSRNLRKSAAIRKEASMKAPIKINSQRNLKKK